MIDRPEGKLEKGVAKDAARVVVKDAVADEVEAIGVVEVMGVAEVTAGPATIAETAIGVNLVAAADEEIAVASGVVEATAASRGSG